MIKDDPEAHDMFVKAMTAKHGGDRKSKDAIKTDNVKLDLATDGNSRAYSIARVQKECGKESISDTFKHTKAVNIDKKQLPLL